MKFRTEIDIPKAEFTISHKDKLVMMGSCFAENISSKMSEAGFNVDVNPFGILYNPISITNGLSDLLNRREYVEDDLFVSRDVYHSFSHHGRFSGTDKATVLSVMNKQLKASKAFLQRADYLIITFGTAKVYRLYSNGRVVSNCHKLPANFFTYSMLSVGEIVQAWLDIIQKLRDGNPQLKIIFTVSPIRHWKDGAHENQISKSTLLLAINELIRWNDGLYYFPSYEIVLDDLRDYRFYKEDMVHPNSQAIEYIWQKFSDTYFNEKTKSVIKEWMSIQQALNHKPFNPESEEYKSFLKKTEERRDRFIQEHSLSV